MKTFPQRFKLADLLQIENSIDAAPLLAALKDIKASGKWPAKMKDIDYVKLEVCTELGNLLTVVNRELELKAHQTDFKPQAADLTPTPLDLDNIPVITEPWQSVRPAFDPEHIYVVMANPERDERLQNMNAEAERRGLKPGYLYLDLARGKERIVLETIQSS